MSYTQKVLSQVQEKYSHQPEFLQTVEEVLTSLSAFLEKNPTYEKHALLERLIIPERIITFRVPWVNDAGEIQVNTGYRVQFNSAIGPYKGGLRFHPTVNESILKFLGFEQIFKNSLTGLPMGGGKGGSDFNPKEKSDNEVMRFVQSFMTELYMHIGPHIDIPAGDIGVGDREIGYLFGQYKKLTHQFEGVLTGKNYNFGGSNIRPEATGYGLVYFVREVLADQDDTLEGKTVLISGSGNVAQYAAEKAIQLGAKVLTMSDSSGTIYDTEGINQEKLATIKDIKNNKRGRIHEYTESFSAEYLEGKTPWHIKADIILPCATQNEIQEADAKNIVNNETKVVAEGSNMSSTNEAVDMLQHSDVLYVPGKASNAGGVAVSGLEMSQNSLRLQWDPEEVDSRLQSIMKDIYKKCVQEGKSKKGIDFVAGANIAGFKKVADAMIQQGVV